MKHKCVYKNGKCECGETDKDFLKGDANSKKKDIAKKMKGEKPIKSLPQDRKQNPDFYKS